MEFPQHTANRSAFRLTPTIEADTWRAIKILPGPKSDEVGLQRSES